MDDEGSDVDAVADDECDDAEDGFADDDGVDADVKSANSSSSSSSTTTSVLAGAACFSPSRSDSKSSKSGGRSRPLCALSTAVCCCCCVCGVCVFICDMEGACCFCAAALAGLNAASNADDMNESTDTGAAG